ncbi:hypothetical protein GJU39_20935 [Pedobacter petrophilus]|uniref:Uncharacterized protein n=1 Tax=Pedobacter petrophilus TaxID=1908241 RepID=A0A7K0G409_9SPHI|nr:hypothetical protein [Pedobacter petrophilus]MRX78548.1 hypothetical protein [Pedobacter petrophilus]
MRFLRHLPFLLALFVLLGHDVVPHLDAVNQVEQVYVDDHNLPLPIQENTSSLGHVFSHLQHSKADRTLIYLNALVKKGALDAQTACLIPEPTGFGQRQLWYVNLIKHRFRETNLVYRFRPQSSFSLRGPPIC